MPHLIEALDCSRFQAQIGLRRWNDEEVGGQRQFTTPFAGGSGTCHPDGHFVLGDHGEDDVGLVFC